MFPSLRSLLLYKPRSDARLAVAEWLEEAGPARVQEIWVVALGHVALALLRVLALAPDERALLIRTAAPPSYLYIFGYSRYSSEDARRACVRRLAQPCRDHKLNFRNFLTGGKMYCGLWLFAYSRFFGAMSSQQPLSLIDNFCSSPGLEM